MPFSSVANFVEFLAYLGLVSQLDLERARSAAPIQTVAGLIDELQRQHLLTPYQVSILKSGETEGLRLGNYKLLYRNASGSFARVFRAQSVVSGRTVGIKVLRQRHAEDPRKVALFHREGELGKRLKHPNIVPIYHVAAEGTQHYFTMEFVEGGNFREFIKIRKRFEPIEASRYLLGMAEGLEYALGLGVTHRDLKLSNVLLSANGVPKLVDFGLAGTDKSFAGLDEEIDRAIEYVTLENGSRAPENDPRSDLYFLGALYYELLTGIPPYPLTKDPEARRLFSRYTRFRPIASVHRALPQAVIDITSRLMLINPNERYQTPAEVAADLRQFLATASPVPTPDHPRAKTRAVEAKPTLLCFERRQKYQETIRDYFTRHGFEIEIVSEVFRGMQRLTTTALAGVILMGESAAHDLPTVFKAAHERCLRQQLPLVLVTTKAQDQFRSQAPKSEIARVLPQKSTLREIRKALEELGVVGQKPEKVAATAVPNATADGADVVETPAEPPRRTAKAAMPSAVPSPHPAVPESPTPPTGKAPGSVETFRKRQRHDVESDEDGDVRLIRNVDGGSTDEDGDVVLIAPPAGNESANPPPASVDNPDLEPAETDTLYASASEVRRLLDDVIPTLERPPSDRVAGEPAPGKRSSKPKPE